MLKSTWNQNTDMRFTSGNMTTYFTKSTLSQHIFSLCLGSISPSPHYLNIYFLFVLAVFHQVRMISKYIFSLCLHCISPSQHYLNIYFLFVLTVFHQVWIISKYIFSLSWLFHQVRIISKYIFSLSWLFHQVRIISKYIFSLSWLFHQVRIISTYIFSFSWQYFTKSALSQNTFSLCLDSISPSPHYLKIYFLFVFTVFHQVRIISKYIFSLSWQYFTKSALSQNIFSLCLGSISPSPHDLKIYFLFVLAVFHKVRIISKYIFSLSWQYFTKSALSQNIFSLCHGSISPNPHYLNPIKFRS